MAFIVINRLSTCTVTSNGKPLADHWGIQEIWTRDKDRRRRKKHYDRCNIEEKNKEIERCNFRNSRGYISSHQTVRQQRIYIKGYSISPFSLFVCALREDETKKSYHRRPPCFFPSSSSSFPFFYVFYSSFLFILLYSISYFCSAGFSSIDLWLSPSFAFRSSSSSFIYFFSFSI